MQLKRTFLSWAGPLFVTFSTTGISAVTPTMPDAGRKTVMIIDTFSGCTERGGTIPCGWHPSRNDVSMYSMVHENGKFFTHISTIGGCTSIGKLFAYSANDYPVLKWVWRVNKLPEGGNETIKRKNDSGAAIYVIFKGRLKLNNIIKYVWSSSLDIGTVTPSPYNGRTRIVVLESGPSLCGRWIHERVNVHDDYERLFGAIPPPIEGIGMLSDSDNTDSPVSADYGDITVQDMME